MAFPRVPKKPVTGKLKLTVRPANVEVVVESDPRELYQNEQDLSSQLTFKLPRGFSMEGDSSRVIQDQEVLALRLLDDLLEQLDTCEECKKYTSKEAIKEAQEIVRYCCRYLKGRSTRYTKILLGHRPDGTIALDCTVGRKLISIYVYHDAVEFGRYEDHTLLQETGLLSNYLATLQEWLQWLVR